MIGPMHGLSISSHLLQTSRGRTDDSLKRCRGIDVFGSGHSCHLGALEPVSDMPCFETFHTPEKASRGLQKGRKDQVVGW